MIWAEVVVEVALCTLQLFPLHLCSYWSLFVWTLTDCPFNILLHICRDFTSKQALVPFSSDREFLTSLYSPHAVRNAVRGFLPWGWLGVKLLSYVISFLPLSLSQSLLYLAVVEDQLKLVQYLLKANANPNSKDRFGMQPMHLATCWLSRVELPIACCRVAIHNMATCYG